MIETSTVKINFRGGIISPGDLLDILEIVSSEYIQQVSFGLRQQLIILVRNDSLQNVLEQLMALDVDLEVNDDAYPNIMSSYPAEEMFIHSGWMSEGVYKDILDALEHKPKLKINLSDSNQSFTPLLTGNINWVASSGSPHFWHLFIRFPQTNHVIEWSEMVYTNDVARFSKDIEFLLTQKKANQTKDDILMNETFFESINKELYITKPAVQRVELPSFNLPYYEGLHKYGNKFWLGVYRRDEMFPVTFLKEICEICLQTKVGQLCSTPWKSIIIKGIADKDKYLWTNLLNKYEINMRHSANELNFQVQDNDAEARKLKCYLVQKFNAMDLRTFGICIGIKTKPKSEIFCSVLIKKKSLFKLFGKTYFHRTLIVGNSISDMQFGRFAGMRTVFVSTTNKNITLPHPDIDLLFDGLESFAHQL